MLDGNLSALRAEEDRIERLEIKEAEMEALIECRTADLMDELTSLVGELEDMYEIDDARDRVLEHIGAMI